MQRFEATAFALIMVCACAKEGSDENWRQVHFHCHDFTHDVNEMATNYQARLTLSQTTTLSEQQEVGADIKYHIIGHEARAERARGMGTDFRFCAGVRYNSDPVHINALRDRFGVADIAYVEARDLATAAKAAVEMAAAATELDKLDIRP